jgi:hypothetical protein
VLVKWIEVNPDKINAIVHMKPPQSKKEVHRGQNNRHHSTNSKITFTSCRHFQVCSPDQPLILCLCPTHSHERSPHPRKRNNKREQECIASSSHILSSRSPHRLQEILLRDGIDMLCGGHERSKALPLFQSP